MCVVVKAAWLAVSLNHHSSLLIYRMGVQFPQIRQTSKKMTLSSVRSSQLLGRITELELQVERETGLMKGFPTGSSLCSSATPKGRIILSYPVPDTTYPVPQYHIPYTITNTQPITDTQYPITDTHYLFANTHYLITNTQYPINRR